MTKAHAAGTLILNQLKNFNESVAYFESSVNPIFEGEIDSLCSNFCDEREDWCGSFDLKEENDCWLAPENWNMSSGEKKPNCKAWFAIDCIDGDYDYWVALFCGVGVGGGDAGFMFSCQVREFGGKVAWKNHLKNEEKLVSDIENLGFKDQNDGSFFLPIRMDASELAKAWDEAGELKGDDDCFQPVRDALETVAQSVPLFDALMQKCQASSKKKT